MNRTFVRTSMLPATEPPNHEPGPVKWLHENLFSTWLNTVLTVLGAAAVAGLIWTAFPGGGIRSGTPPRCANAAISFPPRVPKVAPAGR